MVSVVAADVSLLFGRYCRSTLAKRSIVVPLLE
jgi:hypothetical protein